MTADDVAGPGHGAMRGHEDDEGGGGYGCYDNRSIDEVDYREDGSEGASGEGALQEISPGVDLYLGVKQPET